MRHSLAPAALLLFAGAVALSSTAKAEYDIAYLGLRGSYVFTDENSSTGSGFLDYDTEYGDGFGAGLFMGWVLNENLRLEIEGAYRNADMQSATVTRDVSGPPAYSLAGDVYAVGVDVESIAVMTNLYFDLHVFDGAILPWVGAGVGGVFVDYAIAGSVPDPNFPPPATYPLFDASGNMWVFGYQFMAGITFPVGEGVSMSAAYRFLQTQEFEYSNAAGDQFRTDLTQHSVDLAMQFHL